METLRGVVLENVENGSIVSTDELISYDLLKSDGYKHGTVKHGEKEWSYYDYRYDAVHNTNRVESFWILFQKSQSLRRIFTLALNMPTATLANSLSGRTIVRWGMRV